MRSMTGFGSGAHEIRTPTGVGRALVEIRTVNHRFLDVRVRAARELGDVTALLEQACRDRIPRGRVDVSFRVEGITIAPALDVGRARAAFASLVALRDELAPKAEVPLSLLGAVPELFAECGDCQGLREGALGAFKAAADALDEARTREGAAIEAELRARCTEVGRLVSSIAAREPEAREAQRRRLAQRAERWKTELDVTVEPGRLEQEIVLLADRCDVSEELSRLAVHAKELCTLLGAPGPSGRKLDFFLQEMAREANTLGSKAQDAPTSHAVVALKTEIERMREQVQNVE